MVWEMTAEELLARYAAGERNFAGVDLNPREEDNWISLSCADLREINLRGAHLYRANLGHSDLSGSDCFGAYLGHAGLGCANFSGANLRGATLEASILINTDFSGADLTGANLRWAALVEANFSQSTLERVNLADANLKGAKLRSLIGCNFLWHTTLPDGSIEIGPLYTKG